MKESRLGKLLGLGIGLAGLVVSGGCSVTQRSYAPCGNPLWTGQIDTFIIRREISENGKEREFIKVGDSDGVRDFYALTSDGKKVSLREVKVNNSGHCYSIDGLEDGEYTAVLIDDKGNEYSTGFNLRKVIETRDGNESVHRLFMDGLKEGTFKPNTHLSH